jgi:hypothetical protein
MGPAPVICVHFLDEHHAGPSASLEKLGTGKTRAVASQATNKKKFFGAQPGKFFLRNDAMLWPSRR